jgi:hypothetical protein
VALREFLGSASRSYRQSPAALAFWAASFKDSVPVAYHSKSREMIGADSRSAYAKCLSAQGGHDDPRATCTVILQQCPAPNRRLTAGPC